MNPLLSGEGFAVFDSRWWPAEEIGAACERSIAWLQRRGVGPGDRIAVLANNRIEIVFAIFAARAVGARVLMLNARLTAAELAPIVAAHPAKVVLADAELRSRVPGSDSDL
ncbi:MAG: AMP-binding protein [Myxococcaceae bacterium]